VYPICHNARGNSVEIVKTDCNAVLLEAMVSWARG